MPNKIYVGNIPWSLDEQQLEQVFAEFGKIEEVKIAKDKFSQKSRGFGFITFDSANAAKNAITSRHQYDVEGRLLVVSQSR